MWRLALLYFIFITLQTSFGYREFNTTRLKRQSIPCLTPNSTRGICVVITSCEPLLKVLKSNQDAQSKEFLKKSVCGFQGKYPKVCCQTESPPTTFDVSSTSQFPKECGLSSVTVKKIVGGRPAPLRAWPWIALLGYRSKAAGQIIDWKCGGTLVTNKHVITAAHCILKSLLIVRLGELDFNTRDDGANHVDIPVAGTKSHTTYDASLGIGDIAVVLLKTTVNFSPDIQPICLPFTEPIKSKSFLGFFPYVAGWGKVNIDGPFSSKLLEVQVKVVANKECKDAFAKRGPSNLIFDERVICAGGDTKDSCKGDSGGPLMISQSDGRFYLIGIVSYGYKCAEIGYPGIYTTVTQYLDWISKNAV